MTPLPLKSLSLVTAILFILFSSGPTQLHARSTTHKQTALSDKEPLEGIWKRAAAEEDHDHAHSEPEIQADCAVTEHVLAHEFTELAEEMMLTDMDGEVCHVEEEEEGHAHDVTNETVSSNLTCSSCAAIFDFVQELLLRLNVTTPCCLGDNSTCSDPVDSDPETERRTDPAKAYGYGFLMVVLISACSLLGVLLMPLLNKDSKFHGLYKYIYALMIALGTSALFCDAILHLIPEAFGLHNHGAEEGHAHEEEEEEDQSFIWKGVVVICGLYLFYLFEVTLHAWNSHSHGHHHHHHELATLQSDSDTESPADTTIANNQTNGDRPPSRSRTSSPPREECLELTLPHGPCRDKSGDESGSILHPGLAGSCPCEDTGDAESVEKCTDKKNTKFCSIKIKPLAWVIILGDAIHNFADGLALGAAISQSLSLGVSTMIAIVFHELPHELGDFAILLSTGLKWYVALLFNFASSLTAIVGFFVGVAVGTASSEANSWILAAAAGVFLYIALVDLLPELIHIKENGWTRLALIFMANLGFIISFVILLVIAIYEEELNTLITV